jgi:hypothetical protein
MTAATDVLVPALREVREAEAAVADRLRAHATVAPAEEYRETWEYRIAGARGHVRRIDERMKTLQSRGLVQTVFGGAVHLTGMAVRLPFEVALGVPPCCGGRPPCGPRACGSSTAPSSTWPATSRTATSPTRTTESRPR